MPRRVLFMISSMRGGGSEQQTLLLLQHLDRSQFVPHLYLTERAGDLLPRVPADVTIHAYGDQTREPMVYVPGRMLHRQSQDLSELLERHSIDVIYDRTFHMTLVAGPAARQCRIPRVSTIVSPPELALPMVERRFIWLKRRRLARAYILKEDFEGFYECEDADEARRFFREWVQRAQRSQLELFRKLARRLKRWITGILSYFNHRITNGVAEGINNKIKVLKRRSYGFHDEHYFFLKILQACGALPPLEAINHPHF